MDLLVQRKVFSDKSTIGELYIANNGKTFLPADAHRELLIGAEEDRKLFCHTLEPRKDQSKGKPYLTPAGTYELKIFPSKKFGRRMPHVLNVPGFEAIEIHWGNYPHDTEACTLLGVYKGLPDFIGKSRDTFDAFYDLLVKEESGNKKSTITYIEVAA
jgi:hypothetical protein